MYDEWESLDAPDDKEREWVNYMFLLALPYHTRPYEEYVKTLESFVTLRGDVGTLGTDDCKRNHTEAE